MNSSLTVTVLFASVSLLLGCNHNSGDPAPTSSPPTLSAFTLQGTGSGNPVLVFEASIPHFTTSHTMTIGYRTMDDIALADVDYVEKQGAFVIPPGALTTSAEIEILPDDLAEGHETLILELFPAFAHDAADRYEITGTIIDDD